MLKKYDKNAYDEMFRVMKEGNYSAYVGSVNARGKNKKIRRNVGEGKKGKNGRSQEAFYKYVKTTLKKFS